MFTQKNIKIGRAYVLALCMLGSGNSLAANLALSSGTKVEDHSLANSVIKTFHVKCSNGRLGMIRYDVRSDPVKMCVSVQDGSRPQSCVTVTPAQVAPHTQTLANWVCQ